MLEEPSIISLGDILSFSTKDYEFGQTEITTKKENHTTTYKIGNPKMTSPFMVAIEVVKEDTIHLYDEKTGAKARDKYKVLCQWYSQKTGKFEERWFNQSLVNKISADTSSQFTPDQTAINQKVIFKTANINAFQFDKIKNTFPVTNTDFAGSIIHETSKIFDYLNFTPPAMAIIALEKEQNSLLYNKKTGERNRWISDIKVKCMWYDHISGKFIEGFFSPEALVLLEPSINTV